MNSMVLYRDQGIVLRTQKLGESDRIITLFMLSSGVQRMAAKGVRKTTSKFGSSLEPFTVVDLQGFKGRNLDSITQTQILASYGLAITGDYTRYHAANVIVEAAEKINEGQISSQQYALLVGALRALAGRTFSHTVVRDAYLTRSIALAGWAPEFEVCVLCGATEALTSLSIQHGGVVCYSCRQPGSFAVTVETLELLQGYLVGDWEVTTRSSVASLQQAAGFISAYLQWHLDHSLKSFTVSQRTLEQG